MTPRSCLRWKPTGNIFKTIGLKWIHTGKIFTSSTTKVDSEPTNGSNDDITNQYECEQTLDVSAGTLNLSAGTSFNPKKEGLRVCSELGIHDHSNELSSSKLVPKVVPPADKTATSRQELELLFHHHITMLRVLLFSNHNDEWKILPSVIIKQHCSRYLHFVPWKPCQGDSIESPDLSTIIYTVNGPTELGDGDGDALIPAGVRFITICSMLKLQRRLYALKIQAILKAQELKTKTSAQTLTYTSESDIGFRHIPLPTSSPPLLLPSTNCRAGVSEVTLPPRKRLFIALGLRYEVGESSSAPTARPTRGFRADYSFVATLDDEIRRDPERDVGYRITDTWDEMLMGMPGAPATDETELGWRLTDFVTTVRQDTDEIYGRLDDAQDDRLIETEARLFREAWVQSMDGSDTARSEVRALRTTVWAQQTKITGLRAVDRTRQAHLMETLTLLRTLQTQYKKMRLLEEQCEIFHEVPSEFVSEIVHDTQDNSEKNLILSLQTQLKETVELVVRFSDEKYFVLKEIKSLKDEIKSLQIENQDLKSRESELNNLEKVYETKEFVLLKDIDQMKSQVLELVEKLHISDQEMKQQIILFEEDKKIFLAKNEFLEKVSSSCKKEYNNLWLK
ncbi:hypothetical protein Tco_0906994 [Tanacetum coccineum]|uniref:Uncharacterized protein n=1 Tax=Tanacetum coccineum TaxID=301880 RepID=A0ABQ5CJ34_9ASTR